MAAAGAAGDEATGAAVATAMAADRLNVDTSTCSSRTLAYNAAMALMIGDRLSLECSDRDLAFDAAAMGLAGCSSGAGTSSSLLFAVDEIQSYYAAERFSPDNNSKQDRHSMQEAEVARLCRGRHTSAVCLEEHGTMAPKVAAASSAPDGSSYFDCSSNSSSQLFLILKPAAGKASNLATHRDIT